MYYFLSYFNAKLEFIKTIRFFIYEYLVDVQINLVVLKLAINLKSYEDFLYSQNEYILGTNIKIIIRAIIILLIIKNLLKKIREINNIPLIIKVYPPNLFVLFQLTSSFSDHGVFIPITEFCLFFGR